MPQGDRRGTELDLFDFTYDGEVRSDNYLVGGLGQLTDGVEGHTNFRQDLDGVGRKGYEWVGWKNDSTDRPLMPTASPGSQPPQQPIVEIVFEFERVRNFTAVRFHCNNMFSKEVRVFRRAVMYFSVGGAIYQPQPFVYDFMRDTLIDFARNVIIAIPNRIARFIRVELYFDARWIMVSEVRFESGIC
jgi:discoidin domain receptor family member 2